MKLKTIAIIALCVVASVFIFKSCRSDAKLKKAKAEYAEAKAVAEAEQAISLGHIKDLTNEILVKDNAINGLKAEVKVKDEKIRTIQAELSELQGQEPPTTPEIEALPIVINLRGQVAKLTEMFTLSQEVIKSKDKEIELWAKKYDAQAAISGEWKAMYDKEHQLRLMSEGIVSGLESRVRGAKFLNKVAVVAVAGAVAYGLLK
ncbi:MAG: hypothetical protein M0R06_08645 [Sphaerochaeta sp.]|nr:hypothetical protein [Sphaerochaeta sp.]